MATLYIEMGNLWFKLIWSSTMLLSCCHENNIDAHITFVQSQKTAELASKVLQRLWQRWQEWVSTSEIQSIGGDE
jgi:hypothetical protein